MLLHVKTCYASFVQFRQGSGRLCRFSPGYDRLFQVRSLLANLGQISSGYIKLVQVMTF